MATVTSLGFSIFSRFNGRGVHQAQRALAGLRAQIDTKNFGKAFEDSMKRVDQTNRKAERNFDFSRRTVLTFVGSLVAVSPVAAASAVALAGFGAVAVPTIGRVAKASADLGANWDRLSKQERVSALETRALIAQYRALAKSYEPEVLRGYNTVMGTAIEMLPQLDRFVDQTSGSVQAFTNRILNFTQNRIGGEFLNWAGKAAPEALDVLGTTTVKASDTVLDLVQDMTPLGLTLLRATNGALGFVNALSGANPMLAQFAVGTMLLRGPMNRMVSGFNKLQTRYTSYVASNKSATFATRALNLVMSAGGPILVAAGAALAFFAIKAATSRDSLDRLTDSMRIQREAAGNNLALYNQQAQVLSTKMSGALAQFRDGMAADEGAAQHFNDQMERMQKEVEKARQRVTFMTNNADLLAQRFGVTRTEALRMADAAGVNLAENVDKSGRLTAQAAERINQYQAAVQLANDPTRQIAQAMSDVANSSLLMKDRLASLKTALDAELNPTLDAFTAVTKLRKGFTALTKQVDASKGSMNGNSGAVIALRTKFAEQLATVRDLHEAILQKTHSLDQANAATNRYIPVLYSLAGANKDARDAVNALARITGYDITQTNISKAAFLRQATAMFNSKKVAMQLWRAFQLVRDQTYSTVGSTNLFIQRVKALAGEQYRLAVRTGNGTRSQSVYNDTIRRAIPVLYALAGRNKEAKAAVDRLAASIGTATGRTRISHDNFIRQAHAMGIARDRAEALWKELKKINDRRARIVVTGNAKFAYNPDAFYTGGPVTGAGQPGASQSRDSVYAMLRKNEHVWTPEEVAAVGGHGAMYRLRAMARRGELQGFKGGGQVSGKSVSLTSDPRSNKAVVDDVLHPVQVGWHRFFAEVIDRLKHIYGGSTSVVRAARSMIGYPYSWGGGGKGGPSYGIGRGANTYGFDCSGLTQYAWWKGGRIDIGGTTYSQYPNSRPSARKPGALGFPHMSHVMLASDRPGYVIQAPFTGSYVQEVARPGSRQASWRWPRNARFAVGGAVKSTTLNHALRYGTPSQVEKLRKQMLLGNPKPHETIRLPMYGQGGRLAPGELALTGERGPELVRAGTGGASVAPVSRGGGDVHIHLQNSGVIGSKVEMEDWLVSSVQKLHRQGRIKLND